MSDELDRVIQAIQDTINEDTCATWGEDAFRRWSAPPNMGALPEANARAELRGSCGDTIAISIKFDGDQIGAASFETDGCGPSVVCASVTAELAVGKTAEEALDISDSDVLGKAGQIPEDHHHCAFLAVSALHEAVNQYMRTVSAEHDPARVAPK